MKSYQDSIFPIIYWGLIFSGTKEKSVRAQSKKRDFKIFRASYLPMSFQQLLQNSTTAGFLLHVYDSVMCSCGVRQEREAICGFPINPVLILGSKESANFILFSSDLRRKGMLLGTLLNYSFILVLVFPWISTLVLAKLCRVNWNDWESRHHWTSLPFPRAALRKWRLQKYYHISCK